MPWAEDVCSRTVSEDEFLFGKQRNNGVKGNMRDVATLNQLFVLANLESYNAVLISQGKNPKERMGLLRQLAIQ